jgi:import inner membrane translocase subunit TIM16
MSRATMSVSEAQKILEVADQAPWAEVVKRYKHLNGVNEKHGSFYLQSKVYRAWEALDEEYTRRGLKPPGAEGVDGEAAQQQQQEGGSIGDGAPSQSQQQQQSSQQQQQQQQQNDR